MPRYIDAEVMPKGYSWDILNDKEKLAVLAFLLSQPTADVEHIGVRCENCPSSYESSSGVLYCTEWERNTDANGWCYRG